MVHHANQSPPISNEAWSMDLIVADLQERMLTYGVQATLVLVERGIILEGRASSYYGKQMAQELVRQAKLPVLSNRIRVERNRPPGTISPAPSTAHGGNQGMRPDLSLG